MSSGDIKKKKKKKETLLVSSHVSGMLEGSLAQNGGSHPSRCSVEADLKGGRRAFGVDNGVLRGLRCRQGEAGEGKEVESHSQGQKLPSRLHRALPEQRNSAEENRELRRRKQRSSAEEEENIHN
jgi:hypothetical protein